MRRMCYQKTIPSTAKKCLLTSEEEEKNAREGEARGKEENNANRNNAKLSPCILMEKVAAIPGSNSD